MLKQRKQPNQEKRRKLEKAAPNLLAVCEKVRNKASALQGEWSSIQELYAPEWTHGLKEIVELLDKAIAKVKEI